METNGLATMWLVCVVLVPLLLGSLACALLGRLENPLQTPPSAAPPFARAWVTGVALLCAGSSFLLLLHLAGPVMAGQVWTQTIEWVPALGLEVALRLDGLSLMFALLIAGMGLLIVVYAHFYLSKQDSATKLYSLLMLFMAAMLGVVLSDNLLLLLVFWELTSISSFLLVGYWSQQPEARRGARMALTVTGSGGLVMLAGFVLLGSIGGTFQISELLTQATQLQQDPLFIWAVGLILVGCFSKSAQFPFHFWLPNAMAAPTPVSAYLHSATMVKAGIFLLLRLFPLLAANPFFSHAVLLTGLLTLCIGAFFALFKHDLKGLLAYSTISHLGLVVFLIGLAAFGSPLAMMAAVFHIMNHACFKAALFMSAGIVDHETGSRDMRKLGGLMQYMPITATLVMLAGAAMAGVPLFNGFVSKEMMLTEAVQFAREGAWGLPVSTLIVPVLASLAALWSVAYSLRLVHDTFFNGPMGEVPHPKPHEPHWGMRLPVVLLVLACVALGCFPAAIAGDMVALVVQVAWGAALPAGAYLAIWHGWNLPLLISMLALVLGTLLYLRLMRRRRLHGIKSEAWLGAYSGQALFVRSLARVFKLAGRVTSGLENHSLQRYAAWMLLAAMVAAASAVFSLPMAAGGRTLLPANGIALSMWLLTALLCLALLRWHHQRLLSVILLGVVGLMATLSFVAFSALDLALTQISVDVVSTVLLLMGLALLPPKTPADIHTLRTLSHAGIAAAAGLGVAFLAWVVMTRDFASISHYFLAQSVPKGGGSNVVNVILVDFRGYDTLGEITVLGIAALGVMALLQGLRMHRAKWDAMGQVPTFAQPSLMLRVVAQVVLPLALLVTVYIFMRGHNLPGGGFIAGLVTAIALVLQYMAYGQERAEWLLRARHGERFVRWIALGLLIAGLTGAGAFLFGRPFLTSAFGHPVVAVLGELPLATAALFDLGVYLTVVGATLLTIASLGAVSKEGRS